MRLAPTVIPPRATVDGVIDTPGDVTVQGRVEGEIRAGEAVDVIASATCVATIFARTATIHGELIGNAVCTEAIRVGPGARVVGDLRAPDVQIDADATVDGHVDLLPPEPRTVPMRRLPLSARAPAPPSKLGADHPGETGGEPTAERGATDTARELRVAPRRVPRAPRPRGRVRVAAKREP